MAIDLNSLSMSQLEALIAQANKRKTTLKKRKPIAAVRNKLIAMAQNEGYTVDELFGGKAPAAAPTAAAAAKPGGKPGGKPGRKPGRKAAKKTAAAKRATPARKIGKIPPKFRNPANPTETWTGRGKQPRWLAAYTSKGRKPDEFLIRK